MKIPIQALHKNSKNPKYSMASHEFTSITFLYLFLIADTRTQDADEGNITSTTAHTGLHRIVSKLMLLLRANLHRQQVTFNHFISTRVSHALQHHRIEHVYHHN